MRLLFIGDIVGEVGVGLVTERLPSLRREHAVDVVVANGENMAVTGRTPFNGFGMTGDQVERLRAAGVDVVTSGNHAWDGAEAASVLDDPRVLRPDNVAAELPGKGVLTVEVGSDRLTVVNLASSTAIPGASPLWEAFCALEGLGENCLIDLHGDSVDRKSVV